MTRRDSEALFVLSDEGADEGCRICLQLVLWSDYIIIIIGLVYQDFAVQESSQVGIAGTSPLTTLKKVQTGCSASLAGCCWWWGWGWCIAVVVVVVVVVLVLLLLLLLLLLLSQKLHISVKCEEQ